MHYCCKFYLRNLSTSSFFLCIPLPVPAAHVRISSEEANVRNHSGSLSPAFCEGLLTFFVAEFKSHWYLETSGRWTCLLAQDRCLSLLGRVVKYKQLSDTLYSWALLSLWGKLAGKRFSLTAPRQEAAQDFSSVKIFFSALIVTNWRRLRLKLEDAD